MPSNINRVSSNSVGETTMEYNKQEILNKLTAARTSLLLASPFYGTLMMHLKFSLASCGTACTDMKRIIWDPAFVSRLTAEEIEFVMMHEVLHCVLNHCGRGRGFHQYLFNLAADIVVNSNIMCSKGVTDFEIDGTKVIHLTPDGQEGYLYNVEQVYEMLVTKYQKFISDIEHLREEIETEFGITFDSHDIWETIPIASSLNQEWKSHLKEAAKKAPEGKWLPPGPRQLLNNMDYEAKLNWKALLHEFIQVSNDKYDYTFSPTDRRFANSNFIIPAFHDIEGEKVENIWFNVDTSGSIDDKTLSSIYEEIKVALSQFDYLKGKISFFDTSVTEPQTFESIQDLSNIDPIGGGGTSFHIIFEYMNEHMKENLPTAVIILTDGWAIYPDERVSLGVPVLWILINNNMDAPWGKSIHI